MASQSTAPLSVDITERVENLERVVVELSSQLERVQETLNSQLADIEDQVERLESGAVDRPKARGRREWTEDQRREAGRRLQQARAEKLGLESIEQLHTLKLRPGVRPTKAQIQRVRRDHPVAK